MMRTPFQPDYRHLEDAARNNRPARLPLYEHIICAEIMEKILGVSFADLHGGGPAELAEFFRHHCRFFREMTYDTVSYDEWISRYGDRIGLFGGIDTDRVCRMAPDELFDYVVENGTRFRQTASGYALGSGNSIPDYVPVDGYLAMVRAAQEVRRRETPN